MNMKTLSQATKSNRRHAGKYENYALALQHTISIFSDFVSNLFFKFPIFLSDYFVRSILMSNFFSDFFCPITCPFYLNVRFFVQFFCRIFCPIQLNERFFCPIFLPDCFIRFFFDLFKCLISFVRSFLMSDFFVWFFVRSI